MVHALSEFRRVLMPQGTLIDLRPLAGSWPVEVVSKRETSAAGTVTDLPAGPEDDAAANATMAKGADDGWFRRQREEIFPFSYYWESPNEMQKFLDEEWADFATVDAAVWARLRSLWSVADGDARVRIRMNMLITEWRKTDQDKPTRA